MSEWSAYNVYLDGALAATTASTDAYFGGLTPLTDFVFGVTAIDAEGNESLPTTLNVTTGPDETPDVTPPSIPGNLSGSPSFNSVLLSWDASTDDTQVAGYIIWVDGVVFDTVSASTLSVLVTGLDPETPYSFEVAAFDLAGNLSELAERTLSTTEPLETSEPGLVAHYPFDGDANDATPYQNHGVIGGDPVFETSTHSPSHGGGMNIKFDGMQDSVLAPNAVQLLSDYTTVSFWIRVDGTNPQDAEAYVLDFGTGISVGRSLCRSTSRSSGRPTAIMPNSPISSPIWIAATAMRWSLVSGGTSPWCTMVRMISFTSTV